MPTKQISDAPKKLLFFNPIQIQMMRDISERTGLMTSGEVLKRGLEMLHNKYYPIYKAINTRADEPEEVKIEKKIKQKQITKNINLAHKKSLCDELFGGEVVEVSPEVFVCRFTQFTLEGENEIDLPLSQVDPVVAGNMKYLPSKKAILKKYGKLPK